MQVSSINWKGIISDGERMQCSDCVSFANHLLDKFSYLHGKTLYISCHVKFSVEVNHPNKNTLTSTDFCSYECPSIRAIVKKVRCANGKSITGFALSYRWNVYVTPTATSLSKGSKKRKFDVFSLLKITFHWHKPVRFPFCKKFSCKLVV